MSVPRKSPQGRARFHFYTTNLLVSNNQLCVCVCVCAVGSGVFDVDIDGHSELKNAISIGKR